MRYFALLFLALVGLPAMMPTAAAQPAPNALEIHCVRSGEMPVPAPALPASGGGKLYCEGEQADPLPSLAMGKHVTVILKESPDCDATKPYLLLVDGMSTGITASGCNSELKTLNFRLTHAPVPNKYRPVDAAAVKLLWQRILGDPWNTVDWQRHSWLSVQQWTGSEPSPVSKQVPFLIRIVDISTERGIAALLVLGGFVITLIVLAIRGELTLLRDNGIAPAGSLRTFSLARTQMAWWFGLIFAAYVFLWVVCGELPALSGSALVLLGIAGSTGLIGASLDDPNRLLQESQGWLLDVTSDAHGVTLYRLQHLVWNAFFGATFVIQVASTLTIPEFDSMTLGLMGISAGAYVGFKVPEKNVEVNKDAAHPAADSKSGYSAA